MNQTTYRWRIEYTFSGGAYRTVCDTSLNRSRPEMAVEFECRHPGTKVTDAFLTSVDTGRKPTAALRDSRLPHHTDPPPASYQTEQLTLL